MPLDNALEKVNNFQKIMDIEKIDIKDAHNRVLAENIYSFHDSTI